MTDLERHLNELGVLPRPVPTPPPAQPAATLTRPAGDPRDWPGIWYTESNVPF